MGFFRKSKGLGPNAPVTRTGIDSGGAGYGRSRDPSGVPKQTAWDLVVADGSVEPVAPTAIVVDVSSSMEPYLSEINRVLMALPAAFQSEPLVAERARVGIWTFGDGKVEMIVPFTRPDALPPIQIDVCFGSTPLFRACSEAMDACECLGQALVSLGRDKFRPQVLVATDFESTDETKSTIEQTVARLKMLADRPANKGLTVNVVKCGKSNDAEIQRVVGKAAFEINSPEDVTKFFDWTVRSMTKIATSRIADGVSFTEKLKVEE